MNDMPKPLAVAVLICLVSGAICGIWTLPGFVGVSWPLRFLFGFAGSVAVTVFVFIGISAVLSLLNPRD
jgi:uncharacterized membrane protein